MAPRENGGSHQPTQEASPSPTLTLKAKKEGRGDRFILASTSQRDDLRSLCNIPLTAVICSILIIMLLFGLFVLVCFVLDIS